MECDHTSVGILVWSEGKLLLIERVRPPFGYAPPAGHVDNHGTYLDAAIAELYEETGLRAGELTLIAEKRKNNPCRRVGGEWHNWQVYEATSHEKNVSINVKEVKTFLWCDAIKLSELANRTQMYRKHIISEAEWQQTPGLEPVWEEWLTELGIIGTSDSRS